MPQFKITDTVTGKAVTVSGESAPSHDEAEQIFKDAGLRSDGPHMSWGDVAKGAVTNLPSSIGNLAGSIYQAVRHPIDTAGTALDIGAGELQKLTPSPIRNALNSVDPNPQASQRANNTATNVNNFYGNRYGSMEGFKGSLANDPVGILADAATVAGGVGVAAKAGGLAKAAALADRLGTVSNPITLAGKGIAATAKGGGDLLSEVMGAQTGTSGPTIRTAFNAGLDGGPSAAAFGAHLRDTAPIQEIVTDAKRGLAGLKAQRGADYRANIGATTSDPAILSLDPVDKAIARTNGVNNFKGVDLSPETAATRQKVTDAVELWKTQNPADFHTAEGLDALKKRLGFIKDDLPYDRSADRMVVDQAYNAVRDEITNQSPAYANTMENYAKSSGQINDIEKTLSLTPTANVDTSIRKLQSALRDNVNTSYGRRADLAKVLTETGAPQLMNKIAGQQLSSPTTRGIGKMLFQGEAGGLIPATIFGGPAAGAGVAAAMAMSSPRLVGEATFAAGKGARLAKLLASKIGPREKEALIAEQLGQQQNNSATQLGALLAGRN